MIKAGKWISKHKKLILFIGLVLLVPSVFGYVSTRVNYDVLSYLPETLETVEGQDIMVDEFGMCLKEKFAGFMGDQFVSNIVFILKI